MTNRHGEKCSAEYSSPRLSPAKASQALPQAGAAATPNNPHSARDKIASEAATIAVRKARRGENRNLSAKRQFKALDSRLAHGFHERRLWHRDKSARNERRHETLEGGTKLTHKKRDHERHAIPTAAGLQGREWAVKETVAACVRRQDAV